MRPVANSQLTVQDHVKTNKQNNNSKTFDLWTVLSPSKECVSWFQCFDMFRELGSPLIFLNFYHKRTQWLYIFDHHYDLLKHRFYVITTIFPCRWHCPRGKCKEDFYFIKNPCGNPSWMHLYVHASTGSFIQPIFLKYMTIGTQLASVVLLSILQWGGHWLVTVYLINSSCFSLLGLP